MADLTDGFTLTWKIENFSMLPNQNGDAFDSSCFKFDESKNFVCQLSLYPRGNFKKEENIVCFICNVDSDRDFKAKCYIVLQSTEPSLSIVSEILVYPKKAAESEVGVDLCPRSKIYAMKHLYLPGDTLTLHCHFLPYDEACAKSDENDMYSERYSTKEECVCRSGILSRYRSVMWSIRNINKLGGLVEKCFYSNLFDTPAFKLSMKFDGVETNEFVPIEIRQISSETTAGFFVKCKITVISTDEEHRDSNESTHFFRNKSDVWHFPSFIKVKNLTHGKYLFPGDTLHLQCEFAYSSENDAGYELEDTCMPLTFEMKPNDMTSEMSSSIAKCYSSGKFCDIQLNAGGHTFKAHRLMLGARSSVFSDIFETIDALESNMKEKNPAVVDIVDVDPTTLKIMLAFLYNKEEDLKALLPKDACKLYDAAVKYQIPSLKHYCWGLLSSSLSTASVCDVLVLADAQKDSFLLSIVYNFIRSHSTETFYSSDWRNLMDDNIKLAADVMHKILTENKL